jgi:hypothetical protein
MPPIGAAFPKSRDPEHGFDPAVGDARRTGRMPAVPSATHVNSTYVENMRRLWRLDARLAQRIDEVPPDDLLAVEASRAGPPTAAVVTGDGRRLYLHSRYDPQREAMDFCATLETRDAACIVLSGLGLGHHLRALHDEYGSGSTFLISEPDTATIATAFRHTDLTAVLDSGRIEFITRLDKSYLHERIGRFATVLMLGTQFVVPPVSLQVGADFHQACREAILAFAAYAKMSLVTLVKNAGITCGNVADNLPTYVSTPSLDVLRRRFEGAPAILVAAGPSLGRHLDRLRGLDQRAVVVTAQTTLRLLLGHGVHPHFVTALDYSSVSKQFFENLDIPDDLVLVAEPKASCAVIDAFERRDDAHPGRTILLDNVFARRCVGETLGKRAALEPGATVMHLAFYLAEWMGCDPIILVGQDLGFSGHVYYTPGVTMHRSWDPELGRFGTLEMKEWERIVRHRPILRKILDIHGREIYTDEQMYTYLQQFERDIGRSRCRVIDATEGGARIAGSELMTLDEAIGLFCTRPIDGSRFDYLRSNWRRPDRLAPARDAVRQRRSALEEFRRLCEETRRLLDDMKSLTDRPDEFNRRLARVDDLRTRVQQQDTIFQMVREVSQLGELQKIAADRRMEMTKNAGAARARQQLARDMQFIDALLDGCDRLGVILDGALSRFDVALRDHKP